MENKKTIIRFLIAIFFLGKLAIAQTPNSVGIGTTNPDNSAILHLESSKQGFLMTRLNTSQITSIITPTNGLLMYNTDDNCYWYKHPFGWKRICNTDSLGTVFINSLTTNTLVANTGTIVNLTTNTLVANTGTVVNLTTNTLTTNTFNFGGGIGDSIWVHYADIDTAIIHNLTTNVINTDSLYIGGTPINTYVSNVVDTMAWLLRGNLGTTSTVNFLGTKDAQDLVFRTNNTEKVRIKSTGETGFGTATPAAGTKVDVNGKTKTTNLQMTSGAGLNLIMRSADAVGNGSWTPLATMVSTLSPSTFSANAWTLLGNGGTNGNVNFLGTTDNQRLVLRTNNTEKMTILPTGEVGIGIAAPTSKLEVIGNTKTDNFQMTTGAANTYIMQSDVAGNGSWINPSTLISTVVNTLSPGTFNNNAWTILGNSGTNPAVNFAGTTDAKDWIIRTNNVQKAKYYSSLINHVSFGGNNNIENITIGNVYLSAANPLAYPEIINGNNFIGFNIKRNPTSDNVSTYDAYGNGTTNGSSMVFGTTDGDLKFGVYPSTGGGSSTYSAFQSASAVKYVMGANGQFLLRAANSSTPNISFINNTNSGLSLYTDKTDFIYSGVNSLRLTNGVYVSSVPYGSQVNATLDQMTTNYNGLTISGALIHGKSNVLLNPLGGGSNSLRIFGSLNSLMLCGTNLSNNNTIIGDRNSITIPSPGGSSWVSNNFLATSNSTITTSAGTPITGLYVLGNNLYTNTGGIGFWGYFPNGAAPGTLINSTSSVRMVGGNGYTFFTNDLGTTGVAIAPGGGSWASVSDRNLKENIKPIKCSDVLEKLMKTDVTEWMYISQRPDEFNKLEKQPLHIGPFAQDFSEAFGYGEFNDKITTADMDGVLFASVKALAEENRDLKSQLLEQKILMEELKKLMNEIKNK